MNTRDAIDTSSGPAALSVSLNTGNKRFSVGLDTGFCIFNTDPCELKATRELNAGIGIAEMLGTSNYVALVGGGRQPKYAYNKVIIWDDGKQKAVITLEFRTAVLRVRLSRTRIVVALQNTVHIYKFSAQPEEMAAYETADNPHGLCALTAKVMAFPGRTPGQVQLVEVDTNNVSIIPAHSSALRALGISPDGQLLVTASETGTLLRVYSTANCSRVAELRRGVDYATVFDVAISPDNSMLAVTSDKLTLHVFDLPGISRPSEDSRTSRGASSSVLSDEDASKHKWGIMGKIPFVPRVFSDEYSFASAPFDTGGESASSMNLGAAPRQSIPGMPGGQLVKGLIGWLSDTGIVVIGAGRDARWERFEIVSGEDGKRYCVRNGWRRYLGLG